MPKKPQKLNLRYISGLQFKIPIKFFKIFSDKKTSRIDTVRQISLVPFEPYLKKRLKNIKAVKDTSDSCTEKWTYKRENGFWKIGLANQKNKRL